VTKKRISNKAIVLIKLGIACSAFFACCLFIFDNKQYFIDDFQSMRIFFSIAYIIGTLFIIGYISNMMTRFETKTLWRADRLYILYQFIFTTMLVCIVCRSFFAELVVDKTVVIILILSCVANLLIPPIKDNDNKEF